MKIKLILAITLLALGALPMSAQTCVMAQPVSDRYGNVAFQITQIIRLEGKWEKAPNVGLVLHPRKREKAFPLTRFGEAVLISLPEADNYSKWSGVHIHNGCIPALSGMPADTLIRSIVSAAPEVSGSPESCPEDEDRKPTLYDWGQQECPICHKVHLRL